MKTLSIEELHLEFQKLKKDELIIDVRQPDEFASGHVPGARNIPHTEIAAHADELRGFKNVYIYCHAGGRVQMAMFELSHYGLQNISGVVSGGMPNWVARNFPIER